MFFRKLTYLILLSVTLISCSEYEKVLKSADADLKFQKALKYYEKEDFNRALTLFEQLSVVSRGTKKNDTVMFYLANCYYKQNDLILAGNQFKNFTKVFSNSPFSEEAEFMVGYCYYQISPRPSLDQAESLMAIEAFQLFLVKYPYSEKADQCKKLINELNEKLVEKSYMGARLYYDLGNYKASIIALTNSLAVYPNTKFREEMMFLILKSNFLLANNSIESKKRERYQATLDEYYSFISEFADGENKKEVDKIYETCMKELGLEKSVSNN